MERENTFMTEKNHIKMATLLQINLWLMPFKLNSNGGED